MLNQVLVAHGMYTSSVANKNTVYTSDYTLSANEGIVTNTTGGSFTVKLPANPGIGAQNYVFDGASWATVNLFIDPQTGAIEDFAVSEILKVDVAGGGLQFLYDGTKWKMFWLSLIASGGGDGFAKTGGDVTGNINLSGTGRRLMGLFSGASHVARTLFKGNEANAGSILGVIPDGTATLSQFNFYNRSDPDNASVLTVLSMDTEVSFRSNKIGTGTYLPATWYTSGAEQMRLDTSGNLSVGATTALSATVGRTYLALKGKGTGASDGCGILQFQVNSAGSILPNLGNIEWYINDNSAASNLRAAFITVSTVGAAANNKGSAMSFATKADGDAASAGTTRMVINENGHVVPAITNGYDLGSSTLRWRNIYTQDLHLSNGIGDYTMIEGEEHLYLVNNKNGKHYRFALIAVDPSEVPPKSEAANVS